MSDDERALLRAVLESPDDDQPRLVYADWLEERGDPRDPRGEFIRVQVELDRWRHDDAQRSLSTGGVMRHAALRQRELELFAGHAHDLLGPIPNLATFVAAWPDDIGWLHKRNGEGATAIRAVFRRGFVAEVSCRCEDWLAHGPAVMRDHPVRKVRLTDLWPHQNQFNPARWCWFDRSVPTARGDVTPLEAMPPECLFELLEGGPRSAPLCKWYDLYAEANADLSRAALRWARTFDPTPEPAR